jgi:hypothetical protein
LAHHARCDLAEGGNGAPKTSSISAKLIATTGDLSTGVAASSLNGSYWH